MLPDRLRTFAKAGIIKLMILAFLAYFLSESLLRQAAISSINPQSVNVEGLVSKLPASLRESVNAKIDMTRMRNAVRDAADDSEKVGAIIALAEQGGDTGRRLWLYSELLKQYPSNPEMHRVYLNFLFNEEEGPKFTPADYQAFVLLFDQMTAYNMWVLGINRLIMAKVPQAELLKFIEPLFMQPPEYREYGRLYQEFSKMAAKQDDKELVAKANALFEKSKTLPTFDDVLKKRAAELKAAKQAGRQAAAKSGKGG